MNKLSFSQTNYLFLKFTIFLEKILWINFIFREFTMNLPFREITMNSLFFSRVYYEFTFLSTNSLSFRENAMNILYFSLFHNGFTVCFANSLSFSWIHYGLTIFHANLLWIHSFFREFIIFPFSVYRGFSKNSFSASRIRKLFRENTMN